MTRMYAPFVVLALAAACGCESSPGSGSVGKIAYIEREVVASTRTTDLSDHFAVILNNGLFDEFGVPFLALFRDLSFSPGDEGKHVLIESDDDDPEFSAFAAHLTDDVNGVLLPATRFPAENGGVTETGAGGNEASILVPMRGIEGGPGFEGLEIERFLLTIERLSVEPRDGVWFDFTFRWRFEVFAQVD